jgi:hypothetical protein
VSNKIYTEPESPLKFNAANPSGTRQFTPQGLPHGSGQISDTYDLGSGAHATLFHWRARAGLGASASGAGASVEIYLATASSDGYRDGNLGSGNAMLGDVEKRRNLQYVGSLVIDSTSPASGDPLINSGLVEIKARQVSLVYWNLTGAALASSTGLFEVTLTPEPDSIQ